MTSMWSQSALCPIVSTQAAPRAAKSADRIDGAIIALGDMRCVSCYVCIYLTHRPRGFECVTIRYKQATNSIEGLDYLEQMILGHVVELFRLDGALWTPAEQEGVRARMCFIFTKWGLVGIEVGLNESPCPVRNG